MEHVIKIQKKKTRKPLHVSFFLKICNCTLWKDWSATVTNQHFLHGCTKRKKNWWRLPKKIPIVFVVHANRTQMNATGPRKKPSQATCMNGNGDGGVALNIPLRRHHIAKQIKVSFFISSTANQSVCQLLWRTPSLPFFLSVNDQRWGGFRSSDLQLPCRGNNIICGGLYMLYA